MLLIRMTSPGMAPSRPWIPGELLHLWRTKAGLIALKPAQSECLPKDLGPAFAAVILSSPIYDKNAKTDLRFA